MTNGWTKATPENLTALAAKYSGLGGDDEAETVLAWEKWEPDRVEFTSTRGADIARLIRRCGSAVTEWVDLGESVTLRLTKKAQNGRRAFRGMEYAFAPLDVPSEPWDRSAKEPEVGDEE